jgi:hypothetical protein
MFWGIHSRFQPQSGLIPKNLTDVHTPDAGRKRQGKLPEIARPVAVCASLDQRVVPNVSLLDPKQKSLEVSYLGCLAAGVFQVAAYNRRAEEGPGRAGAKVVSWYMIQC